MDEDVPNSSTQQKTTQNLADVDDQRFEKKIHRSIFVVFEIYKKNHSLFILCSLIPDLIAPTNAAITSLTSSNRLVGSGASPKIKNLIPSTATTNQSTNSSNVKKWDPPLLLPLPSTFLRLTPNGVRII